MENVRSIEWTLVDALAARRGRVGARTSGDRALGRPAARLLERLQGFQHVLDARDLRVDVLSAAYQGIEFASAFGDDALGLRPGLPLDPVRLALDVGLLLLGLLEQSLDL